MKHALIVVSLLDGKGPTGVEAHFNQIIARARAFDIDVRHVCPYPPLRTWTRIGGAGRRMLARVDRERAAILDYWLQGKVIEAKLERLLAQARARGNAVTLYAQDTVSAQVALRLRRRHGCRVVVVVHYNVSVADELVLKGEAVRHGPLWRHATDTERDTLPHADSVIFVSQFMRGVVLERLPQLAGVTHAVIPNFIAEPVAPAPRATYDADVIAIGTLEPRKNHAFLLRVLARARERGHRYTLTLVGNGPEQAPLARLANELGIADQVRFAGFRSNAASLIPRHRVLAHAALVENMPITLIEAMAAGRPILAPAVGGIAEVFADDTAGFHWPLDDVAAAAAMLVDVLSDAALYDRLAAAALERYRNGFDSDMLVSHWLTALFGTHGANHATWQKRLHGGVPGVPVVPAGVAAGVAARVAAHPEGTAQRAGTGAR